MVGSRFVLRWAWANGSCVGVSGMVMVRCGIRVGEDVVGC